MYLTCERRDPALVQPLEQQAQAVRRVPDLRLVQVVVFAVLPHQSKLTCEMGIGAVTIVSLLRVKGRV